MQRKTDLELTNGVKERNCSDCLQELFDRHSAMSYNPNKGSKFSTWLANQMRYFCLNTMNKNRLVATEDETMNAIVHADSLLSGAGETSVEEKVDFIKNIIAQVKDRRVSKIFKIRYFNGNRKKTPWSNIAKEIGVSTQTAINLHNKAIKLIKTKMNTKEIAGMDKI